MERLGIPTVSIITHVFLNTAKAMTRMMGVPDFEFVVAQHPLSSLNDDECQEMAAKIAPDVERILVGRNGGPQDWSSFTRMNRCRLAMRIYGNIVCVAGLWLSINGNGAAKNRSLAFGGVSSRLESISAL